MGHVIAVFSESLPAFFRCAAKFPISLQERRRLLGTPLRYCIGGEYFYAPAEQDGLPDLAQLSWARLPSEIAMDLPVGFGERLPAEWCLENFEDLGVYTGDRYVQRRKETPSGVIDVASFGAEELIKAIQQNPDALDDVSKGDFEALCAEVFVSRGFKVDLFRKVKDDGIDFLAVEDGDADPIVYAVSCKHPDRKRDGALKATSVAPVREVFGVSAAFGFGGAVTITSSRFSPAAKQFSELDSERIKLVEGADLLRWISEYRWNEDEK